MGAEGLLLNATIKKKEFKKATRTHSRIGSDRQRAQRKRELTRTQTQRKQHAHARTHTGLHSSKWCPFPVGSFSTADRVPKGDSQSSITSFLFFLHLYTYITFLPLDVYNIYNWIFCFVLFVCCLLFTSFVLSVSLKSYTCVHSLLTFCVYVFS